MARKRAETVQLKVRLPETLRRQLARAAKNQGHSMNSEIIERLRKSFQASDHNKLIAQAIIESYPDIADRMDEIFQEARYDPSGMDEGEKQPY